MAGLKLPRWIMSLLRRWFPRPVSAYRRPLPRFVKPRLDILEERWSPTSISATPPFALGSATLPPLEREMTVSTFSRTQQQEESPGLMLSEEIALFSSPPAQPDEGVVSTKTATVEPESFPSSLFRQPETTARDRLFTHLASRPLSPLSTPPKPLAPPPANQGGGGGASRNGSSTPNAGMGGGGPTGGGGSGPGLVNANNFLGDTFGAGGNTGTPSAGPAATLAAHAAATPSTPVASSSLTAFQTTYAMTAPTPTATSALASTSPAAGTHGHKHDPLYVLDLNTGETLPANATLNTFSEWSENLLAQVAGTPVKSYSWDLSQAPDFTPSSDTTSANLQGTWATFPGPARTDTISVTETAQDNSQLTQTMTFVVAGYDSPAYSSTRPTSSSTWPAGNQSTNAVITPDQLLSGQATQAAGPYASIGLADGSVQTAFAMPSYNPNTTPVSLDYNSAAANPQPIFLTEYQLPFGQSVPSTVTAQLTFNGTALATYSTAGLNPGDIVQIALQANATGLSTGRYPWSITVTNGSTPTTYSGNVDIVNQANSPYGAGWSLDNVEQLVPVYTAGVLAGVILVNPDGTSLWFASNGQGGFTTPAGDFSTLTLSNGVYTRTMPDGTQINFNSSGQETSMVDRDGNTTTFNYTNGLLTSITDMNGQVTTLNYTNGQLTSITDPAHRTATLAYTGSQLTSITDPANEVWQYAYDASNDLTTLTDPNTNTTTFTYNFADRIASVTQPDSTTEQLTAEQMNGLATPGSGTPGNPAPAVLLASGDQALFTDANNNVWTTGFDWLGFGLPVLSADPLGDTSLNYVNAHGLAWLSADALGRRTRDFFDGNGNVTEEVAPDDSTQEYQYNQFSEVTQYTDQENNVTTYAYNSKGDLTQTTDALNDVTTYAYNNAGLVTSTTDANTNTTTYAYNNLNELTSTTNALNGTTTYAYNAAGDLTSTTDARGFVTTYSYNALGWMTGETLPDTPGVFSTYTYTYDKVGNLLSSTDPLNHTTSYGYNAVNEQTSVTNPLNQTTTYGYDPVGNRTSVTNPLVQTTTYGYNAANELISVTDPLNNQTTYSYDQAGEEVTVTDPMGNVTIYGYTPRGEVASESVYAPTGSGSGSASGSRTTGASALAPEDAAPNGGISTNYIPVYQVNNTFYKCGCPESTTVVIIFSNLAGGDMGGSIGGGPQAGDRVIGNFGGGIDSSSFYFTDYGSIDGNNDPGGYTGDMSGTVNGNTLSGTFALNGYSGTVSGTISGNTVSGTYSGPNISGSFSGTISSSSPLSSAASLSPSGSGSGSGSGSSGETITYQRDALHRVTAVTDALNQTTTYVYDKVGNTTSVTDPNNNTTTYAYNALNKVTSVTNALNQTTTYGYDPSGNLTKVMDPLSNVTNYSYDGQGRVLTATAPNNGVTQYNYDLAGNLSSLTDPDNYTTSYAYNAANELTSTTNPQNYPMTYAYNQGGLLTSMTDADGHTINYAYNADGQETSQTWVNGNYVATYGYNPDGEMTSASDPFSTYTFTYDALGHETSMSNAGTPGVPTVTLSYAYDNFDNRTSLTDSLGGSISYGYNADNQLTSLGLSVSGALDAQVTMAYDGVGNLTGLTRTAPSASGSDTITTTFSYDKANELTNITHIDTTKGLTLASYTYGYNQGGQLTSYQDNSGNALTYGYDPNGELTSATGSLAGSNYTFTYNYDLNGNRTSTSTDVNGNLTSATYTTVAGNELTNDGTYRYTYDHNGNLLTQTNLQTGSVTYYTWDYENRLTEVQVKDNQGNLLQDETFTYDVFGNRIAVSLNGTPQLYTVYDGANPYMDFNGRGTLTERYLTNPYALSQFYGQVSASGTVQWFLTDNLGSIRQVVDTGGNPLYAVTYDPYGNILSQMNATNAPRFGFAGGAVDSVTGDYLFWARPYNPADGRFSTQDWEGFAAGNPNLYGYAFNAPTYRSDPTGLSSILVGLPSVVPGGFAGIGRGISSVVSGGFAGIGRGISSVVPGGFAGIGRGISSVVSGGLSGAGGGLFSVISGGWTGVVGGCVFGLPVAQAGGPRPLPVPGGGRRPPPPPPPAGNYFDLNLSVGYWLGLTGGVQYDLTTSTWHPYFGGGIVSPGVGVNVTHGTGGVVPGFQVGAQGGIIVVGQVGYAFGTGGGGFSELGIGAPLGFSLTGYYVW